MAQVYLVGNACGQVGHRIDLGLVPGAPFGVYRTKCAKGRFVRTMNRDAQIGPYPQIGNREIVADARVRFRMFNDQWTVVAFDILTK